MSILWLFNLSFYRLYDSFVQIGKLKLREVNALLKSHTAQPSET